MTSFSRGGMVDFVPEIWTELAFALDANGDHDAAVAILRDAVEAMRRALERTDPPWNQTLLERQEPRALLETAKAWAVPLGNLG